MARMLKSPLLWIALVLLLVVVAGGLAVLALRSGPDIEEHSYLVVDLRGTMSEYDPPADLFSRLTGTSPITLQRTLGNLEKAAADDRIDGVIFKLSYTTVTGAASRQELRAAIARVRDAGKRAVVWAEMLTPATVHLAAACDTVAVIPTGSVTFTGAAVTSMHLRSMLDKLRIEPDLHKIKDYKAAAEMLTRTDMSEPARENREWLLDEMWSLTMADLARDRGIDEAKAVELMERAVFTAEEAREALLVDELWYWDQLEAALKGDQEELRTVSAAAYSEVDPEDVGLGGGTTIAVVHAQGTIGGRNNRINPLLGVMMGHESVVADLKRAERDDDVAAVVFRVDSRGGEGLASDLIARQVDIMKETKPVVVSMVDVAASGGYVVSYRGSRILADPMTVTGSIGSISGKFDMSGFYEMLGITHDQVTKGPMALMFSDLRGFTDEERERFEANHWASFNQWLADVAARRGMTFEEAESLAHGRVWSGRQAVENGLVDELGGLHRAVEVAKELAGIDPDEAVTLVHYPEQKTLFQMLIEQDEGIAAAAARWTIYQLVREDLAQAVRLVEGPSLMMDELEVR